MKTTATAMVMVMGLLALGCASESRPAALIHGGEPVVFDVGAPTETVDVTCQVDGAFSCASLQEMQGSGVWCYTDPDDGFAPRLDLDVADWGACEMCVVALCDPHCCAYWAPASCPAPSPAPTQCAAGDHDCISPDAPRVCSDSGAWAPMTGPECDEACPTLCP